MNLSDIENRPPSGYYRTTGEWIAYYQSRGYPMEDQFMELYDDHSSDYRMPKGLEEPIPWQFRQKPYSIHPSPFVAIIPEGRIWGLKGAVIATDNKLLWDVSVEQVGYMPEQHSVFHQNNGSPIEYRAETLGVLTYTASDSYFHWMLDVLPRIDLLRQSGITIDKYVFNTSPSPPYQQETLALLNIPPDKRLEIGATANIKAKRLVVPSHIGYTSNYPKWAVDFLRKEFSKYTQMEHEGKYERIYISRDDANYRKVTNETQVTDLLNKYNFKKIILSQYSVAEQIRIFASAQIIISPHGANMTNLLFCKPGTKVIEIFSPGYVNPIYWVISNHADLDYYYVIGNGIRSPENIFEFARGTEDIEANIDDLTRVIQLAGL